MKEQKYGSKGTSLFGCHKLSSLNDTVEDGDNNVILEEMLDTEVAGCGDEFEDD